MKIVLSLLLTFMLSSCLGPEKGIEDDKITGSAPDSDFHSGGGSGSASEESAALKSDIVFKNYAQYNMNLSKATGISMAKVSDVYLKVKNSLPSSTDPSLFNSFTLLSYTRLAFEYCNYFVDEGAAFSGINYNTASNVQLIEALINHFLTAPPTDTPNLYDPVREELGKIYINDVVTTQDGKRYIKTDGVTSEIQKIRLTKMACSALLSSSYFTTM